MKHTATNSFQKSLYGIFLQGDTFFNLISNNSAHRRHLCRCADCLNFLSAAFSKAGKWQFKQRRWIRPAAVTVL